MEITTKSAPDARLTVKRYLVLCDDVVIDSFHTYTQAWASFRLLCEYHIGKRVTLAPVAYEVEFKE